MPRAIFAQVLCGVASVLAGSPAAAQEHAATAVLFDGSSLAGWQAEGAAEWAVADDAIAASAAEGDTGWLVLDRGYQDFILTFAFQCDGCEAGVALRRTRLGSGGTTALYAAVAGPDAATASRVTLDASGAQVERTRLHEFVGRSRLPYMQLRITPEADGWTAVRIQVRGGATENEDTSGAEPAPVGAAPMYGPLALHVSRGDVRYRDISLMDLTRPAAGLLAEETAPGFRTLQLTDRFYAEGIAAGDVNRDGVTDVVVGPFAYIGPDFRRAHEIYPPEPYSIAGPGQRGRYTDSFLSYVHDFDGDGWADVLKVNFNGAFLYVNPAGESRHWPEHKVVDAVSAETTQLADLDGDGRVELVMSTGRGDERVVGLAIPGADPTEPWSFHAVSAQGDWGGHAMGYGDVNGDGRADILQGSGWWEQPAAGATSGEWSFHPVPFGRGTDPFVRGADMFAYDVNGDALPDVITSVFAHGPGLVWYEQQRTDQGDIRWKEHVIMDDPAAPPADRTAWETTDRSVAFTELHALALVDMDGDGLKDIVTGKRWWSHGIEYSENDLDDPPVVYWFELARGPDGTVQFTPHLINNYAGIGTQIAAVDIDANDTPDVLTASRKGAFVFFNNLSGGAKPTAAAARPR